MKRKHSKQAILLIHCSDKKGIVLAVTEFIYKNNGNITYLDQHVDTESQRFFMRLEWDLDGFQIPEDKIQEYFSILVGKKFEMTWTLYFSDDKPRMAIFVSRRAHCLYDIIGNYSAGELSVEIPLIISNHQLLEPIAQKFNIDYLYLPITRENKVDQETKQLDLLKKYKIDFVVLARYMQILSPDFVAQYENRIINIHHSFLPAFPGARPYLSAYNRGVKIIGATSHYVTAELDAGPIIEQDVVRVSHVDSVHDLERKGRDLEKVVLSRAIWLHVHRKILIYNNRTVIFS